MSRLIFILLLVVGGGIQGFSQQFRFSDGLYRIPYASGVSVEVSTNVWNHSPLGCFDMHGEGQLSYNIVAAAGGWIRAIRDNFNVSCYETCCGDKNNFIILEHPNGEWSSYIHLRQNSITNLGHDVGDWVDAGDALGIEGAVGCASGDHLHLEVSRPTTTPQWDSWDGVLRRHGELVNPVFSSVTTGYLAAGATYTAAGFTFDCPTSIIHSATVTNLVLRADNSITATSVFNTGGTGMYRAGTAITLSPGFVAKAGVMFCAQIKTCNQHD
jgi:hypothetical protein